MTVREQIVNSLDKFLANCKNTFTAIANVVDNCASTSTTMPLSANQGKVLQDQITELNTDLTTLETGHGTKNDSLISSTGFECNYFKVGRICSVKFAFTALTYISPEGILLASGFPPAAELQYVSIPVIAPDGSVQQGNLAITTNGTLLNFYGYGIKANSWIKGGFVYITSE